MNPLLTIAAVLAVLIGIAHSFLGEKHILIRLFRREDLPKIGGSDRFTRRTLRFAWHLTTVAWWGFAAVLLVLASGREGAVLPVVAATFLASALVTLAASQARHLAWVVFLAIAVLVWLAGR